MQMKCVCVFLLLVLIDIFQTAQAQRDIKVDLLTMRQGDIHHGRVDMQQFELLTPYGQISVPHAQMARLIFGKAGDTDLLITRQGERYMGQLLNRQIPLQRVIETRLIVDTTDISEIVFSAHVPETKTPSIDQPLAHWVETRNGDHFFAVIDLPGLSVQTGNGEQQLPAANMRIVDFAQVMDEDDIRVQVSGSDGRIVQGRPVIEEVSVSTAYGDLRIPVRQLETLSFTASRSPLSVSNVRQQNTTLKSIRDSMLGGGTAPEVVILPAGRFIRGDAQGDEDEKPPHEINLPSFAIGKYEITFEQYDQFCLDTGRSLADDGDWGRHNRPAINVSWEDAVAYSQWLSKKTRKKYRLPSDAEWEYAARAGSNSTFWWGNESGTAMANCEGCGSLWDGEKTAPTGKFNPNAFGLHDTAGNVFEWVADCYHTSFSIAPKNGAAFDKPGCGKRVIRGGAWSFPPKEIRSANRWRDFPTRRSDDTGFRIVRELEQQ